MILVEAQTSHALNDFTSDPLLKVDQIKSLTIQEFSINQPLELTGIVTLTDSERNMFVLQDETGAIGLHPDRGEIPVKPGQRIKLNALACAPFVFDSPDYPFSPAGKKILPALEFQFGYTEFQLSRIRGWLRPKSTGQYRFWISSDNSSILLLGSGESPLNAQMIANVKAGGWTAPHEWNRYPTQQSEVYTLDAGQLYYLEVIQEQQRELSHLSVAWKGPGIDRQIIGGEFLIPWPDSNAELPNKTEDLDGQGVLHEYWNHYTVSNVNPVMASHPEATGLTILHPEFTILEEAVWPEPRTIDLSNNLDINDQFRFIETEAVVRFISVVKDRITIELTAGQNHPVLEIKNWAREDLMPSPGMQVKFRGVCEGGRDLNGNLKITLLTSPNDYHIELGETTATVHELSALPSQPPGEPTLSGYYFTRGVVTFNSEVLGQHRLYVQDSLGGIFISLEHFPINVPIHVGYGVEIGGNPLPRNYAPGILPMTISILGMHSMPEPQVVPPNAEISDYRDGLWMASEGVVHYVDEHGMLGIKNGGNTLLAWVNDANQTLLDQWINSKLRIRGVLSLDTLDAPVLLTPSPSFVEILVPSPALPEKPLPICDLLNMDENDEREHRVKIQGNVTYKDDKYFYLQDASGAIRVYARASSLPDLNSSVQVVGFLNTDGNNNQLRDAIWNRKMVELNLKNNQPDLGGLKFIDNGKLITVEGKLVSYNPADNKQVLRLQGGNSFFEALQSKSVDAIANLAVGSTLKITGICILEPAKVNNSSEASIKASSAILKQVLLRGADDLIVLRGPPWWTLRRTVSLIIVLLALLSILLLSMFYLHLRHARQQAARLEFAREMMVSQESERRRIAASIHDSLGQDLLIIRNQASRALQSTSENELDLRQRLEDISSTTLQAINQVREITHNLRPYQLDRLGLTQAIRALTRKVSDTSSVKLASLVDEVDDMFDKDTEIHIYRIIQEGIANIIKHSGATEATIVVKAKIPKLSISIRDNGKGLTNGAATSHSGLGLSSIRERTRIMSGTTKIDALSGQGVNLQVDIPIPQRIRPKNHD